MSTPVVTLTLNPAIDQTVTLDALTPGAVHRAAGVRHDAGGKGVNVASCLADWGVPVAAAGLLGADNAAPFTALFAAKGIADHFLRVAGETRTNIKLVDRRAGDTTDINLPGLRPGPAALAAVEAALDGLVGDGTVAVLAGSVPDGLDPGAYARLIPRLAARGARVVLDTSGVPLARALAGEMPFCVKPNRHELEVWAGRRLTDRADLLGVARRLNAAGVGLVAVSLGAEGALFVTDREALHAGALEVTGGSSVGAGDAMVAGLVAGLHDALPLGALARRATAFAVAKLGRPGPHLPERTTVESIAAAVAVTPAEGWAAAASTPAPI
ncbi:1-phosphofructokinase [Ancylobacter lacus]|uniref:1-phosphofructokinase n=1 Tax=Ancylobacter lacus TaxID=2579970 RepID=UPI001BCE87A6|nr:1-phosphofructokinase [Ancylobacter lacus]MBS7537979.1 1-phosphofructokinase [Ancylobacter lacus]